MRDEDKFVHDNEFHSNKACERAFSVTKKKENSFLKKLCAFYFVSILFSLMHLTLCDKVNVMLDEVTGHVSVLVTCATL